MGTTDADAAAVDSGVDAGGAASCESLSHGCGGIIEGEWSVVSNCVDDHLFVRQLRDNCDMIFEVETTSQAASGLASFAAGDYRLDFTHSAAFAFTTASSCFSIFGGCEAYAQLIKDSGGEADCRTMTSRCVCTATARQTVLESGTYSVTSSSVRLQSQLGVDTAIHCADRGFLRLDLNLARDPSAESILLRK